MNCPKCNSDQVVRKGFQYRSGVGKVQQYLCKSCGRITTNPIYEKLDRKQEG